MPRKKRHFVRDAKILKDKALYSLSRGLAAFNSHENSGRVTAVLLYFQHAAEMLVKGALIQRGCAVFDKKSHKAEGMKRCLNRAKEHLQSSEGEIGVFRTIDALRDTEQHWYAAVPEEILYLESRAFITAFDDVLARVFGEKVADFFPSRVLPISTLPVPRDTIHLFDSNYRQIQALLVPGKRQRDNALGLIRTLLAMESHVVDEVEVNEADVRRVERVARSGRDWTVAFPRLCQIRTEFQGEGQEILVRFSKTEGAPVRFVAADDPTEAAAVREIDLQRRFRYSASELAKLIGLTTNKSAVLKRYCKTDSDPQCVHEFVFGSQKHKRYSAGLVSGADLIECRSRPGEHLSYLVKRGMQSSAWISFEHLGDGPHYVYLLFATTRIGAVGCPAQDAHRAWEFLPLSDFIRNIRINWRSPPDGILLSERTNGPNTLQMNPQYYSSPPADHRLFAPYFAHPEFYRARLYNHVRGMRERKRNVRIFFGGTNSRSAYSEKFRFPILSRDKILDHIIARFEWAIKTELSESGLQPIVIVSTSDPRDVFDKYELSLSEYMDAMSRSNFAICPPGWLIPHSHNLVEAMSVGTIPITNYDSYVRPSLTPGSNCLGFSTLEELERVIDFALCMPLAEIQRLREGVISYYNGYIEPKRFGKKLMECL